ncbi:DNA alkylation repair protein [Desulfovibrio caledoniensis]
MTKVADVSEERLRELHSGTVESGNLAEGLAIDFHELARQSLPRLTTGSLNALRDGAALGITKRMALAGTVCLRDYGMAGLDTLRSHPSDTVRGFACYMIGAQPDTPLADRLERIRPLAGDTHFGVREWAWLGIRSHIAAAIDEAVALLAPWSAEASANLRRFASEATRPRGVWSPYIKRLREHPEIGLPILAPLKADAAKYVRDSVGNWLNDAAKDKPQWVLATLEQWRLAPDGPVHPGVVKAATRSIK